MAEAKRVSVHVPEWTERLEKDKLKATALQGSFRGKTFEQLTLKERDDLLKAVAIQLKLIEAS